MVEESATVTLTWQTEDALKSGAITLTAHGIGLDAALDALLAGLDAATDPAYVVTRAQVRETVDRDHRPRPTLDERTPTPRAVTVQADPPRPVQHVQVATRTGREA